MFQRNGLARRYGVPVALSALALLLASHPAVAPAQDSPPQEPPPLEEPKAEQPEEAPAQDAAQAQPESENPADELSDADRAAQLERAIEVGDERLTELHDAVQQREAEYKKAWEAFKTLDQQYEQARRQLNELRGEGNKEQLQQVLATFDKLQQQRQAAKDQFSTAIHARKALSLQIDSVKEKINEHKQVLAELLGIPLEEAEPTEPEQARDDAGAAAGQASASPAPVVQAAAEQPVPAGTESETEPASEASADAQTPASIDEQRAGDQFPVAVQSEEPPRRDAVLDGRIALQQGQDQPVDDVEPGAKDSSETSTPAPQQFLTWLADYWDEIFFIVLIVIGMFVLRRVARFGDRRLVALISRTGRGPAEDRENRARTLVGVFHSVTSVLIVVGGLLLIVATINPDWIAPLLGAMAVVGIAVGLGTQNLVRDYFHGFVLLLENQYTVNDVVKIGETSGLVEHITLRMTVLRDLEGTAHFIPHGQIAMVSNMTHLWSRAVLAVGVAYKEDVDRVMEVLMQLGRELREDAEFADLILEDPEMLGVDAFGQSEVVIKFFLKTKPLKQWAVKRELQRRIKKKFDELGIEIPFPHRTLFVHQENGPAQPAPHTPRTDKARGGVGKP